ncbi:hypothetical protein [Ralstonia solanacearum]|uniref:hypothetical protein n=1 Tax=Ralstonia solanacearum TaxID=305 RepID=UPI001FF06BC7|nr:hypothetical protein [Ralstonia solanacearum]
MRATTTLDACHCCEGQTGPVPVQNAPGLPALTYRVDTQPGFYARMLQSLPLARSNANDAAAPRPLARLLTRTQDDPTVALIDAAACVADVLTFYQERIANEGYLRTATERRSVLELARAIGYELKPGVAASVYLAFMVEDAPGAPGIVTLAQGTAVQSIPPQGKLPQVFETGAEIVARAEWNALVPRQARPADMAVLHADSGMSPDAGRDVLVLLGSSGSFLAGTNGLHEGLASAALYRLDPNLPIDPEVDAIEVGRVYFTEAAGTIRGGDLLLFVAKNGTGASKTLVLRAIDVVPEPALKRIRVDLEPLPAPHALTPAPLAGLTLRYRVPPIARFAQAQVASMPFTLSSISSAVVSKAWRESDLQAMIGIQGWNAANLATLAVAQPLPSLAPKGGAFAFGAKLGIFGHNAPRWGSLPNGANGANVIHDDPYAKGWDAGDKADSGGSTLPLPRTVWETSQGAHPPAARAACCWNAPCRASRAIAGWYSMRPKQRRRPTPWSMHVRPRRRISASPDVRCSFAWRMRKARRWRWRRPSRRSISVPPARMWRASNWIWPICRSTNRSRPATRWWNSIAWCLASRPASRWRWSASVQTCPASVRPKSPCWPTSCTPTDAARSRSSTH